MNKTITRTIHYTDAGENIPKDVQQPVNFTQSGVIDKVTGQWIKPLTWSATKQDVAEVRTPVINGYHVTNVDKDSQDNANVDKVTLHNDDNSYTVTVTYAPNEKIIPVDPNGKPIPNAPTPQYPTDPNNLAKVTPDEPVPNIPGWTPSQPTVTLKNPGKDTEVTYNVPTKDEGVVNVIVTDTTTGQNLTDYGWTSGTQKTVTKVDFDKPGTIKKLEDAGYKVTNPDVTVPGEVTKGTTNIVIKVEHQIVPVTPDKPGNGLKNTDLTKTVTETVHYVGAGDQTPTDKTTQLHFTGTAYYDAVTGKWTDANGHELKDQTKNITWTAKDGNKFAAVATPTVDGYTAKVQDGYDNGNGNVKELSNIEPTSGNIDVTVTYSKNGQPTTPTNPENPNTPMNPEKPTDNPNGPETPVNPGTPTNSNTSNGQSAPVYPGTSLSTGLNTPTSPTSPMNLANSGATSATVQPLANSGAGYAMSNNQYTATAQGGTSLPQTGNNDAVSAAALGLMGLAAATGLGLGVAKKRHE